MSVYIKDMEMPKSCWDCEVGGAQQMDNATCPFYSMEYWDQENYQDKIADGCPLVPVPPHGQLKDADALKNIVFEALNDAITDGNSTPLGRALCVFIAKNIVDEIDALPTIIPADPVKDEQT